MSRIFNKRLFINKFDRKENVNLTP